MRKFFFPKIHPILKLEVGFFSGKKKFFADFPKYGKFFLSKLHFYKFSTKLRTFFFPKIPQILKVEVGFFSGKKSFSQIFQNTANFFHLNFISVNFHKNQRNFFGREGGRELMTIGISIFFFRKYLRFWNLKLDFCPLKKVFEIFCRNIVNHLSLN